LNFHRFLEFDELHTYRGRQGADVALLIRRCRMAFGGHDIICVGTSATMASEGSSIDQKREVAKVAETLALDWSRRDALKQSLNDALSSPDGPPADGCLPLRCGLITCACGETRSWRAPEGLAAS
jgi:hypothetical protein